MESSYATLVSGVHSLNFLVGKFLPIVVDPRK